MRLFNCQNCGQLLYFENHHCTQCKAVLGFVPATTSLRAIEADGELWREIGVADGPRFRICDNAAHQACNWLVPEDDGNAYCFACRHNRTVPDLSVPANLAPWRALEFAKHRLFYGLMRLCLPAPTRTEDPKEGLAFDFLAEMPGGPRVMTGHDNGLITIALKEGDETERKRLQIQMGELYRTPLGHFRHEVGHYYWDRLVRDGGRLDAFRALFGDERQDYEAALRAHYNRQDEGAWRESFVSLYASSHPWEDFAETWAHYLHIVDTMEMAAAFGVRVDPKLARDPGLHAQYSGDPYKIATIEELVAAWLPLTYAMNSLNRAMGHGDLYPFVLPAPVIGKLGFIHDLIASRPGQGEGAGQLSAQAA